MPFKHLIQNKILDYVRDSETFHEVTYDSQNRASSSTLPQKGREVLASAHANEISSGFGLDTRHGRNRKQRRTQWTFQLKLSFKKEVSLELFEEAWMSDPPVLTRTDTSSKQVTLFLERSEINHPPQQNSSTGTKAVFTILAELSRN